MASIIQSQSGIVSAFNLSSTPDNTSVLVLFVFIPNSAAHPSGCAALWTKLADSPDEWRGVGPFTGTTVSVMPGRTPPAVNALIAEVAP